MYKTATTLSPPGRENRVVGTGKIDFLFLAVLLNAKTQIFYYYKKTPRR